MLPATRLSAHCNERSHVWPTLCQSVLIGLLCTVLCSACSKKEAPDGTPIPASFRAGEVYSDASDDSYQRALTRDELNALAVLLSQAHLVEDEHFPCDAALVVVVLDGKRWVVYHNALYLEAVGRTKRMSAKGAPGWANHNLPDWKLLVDWAKQQPEWPDE